jgi:hypothetical protein
MEVDDKGLEAGKRDKSLIAYVTPGLDEAIRMWAKVAGWSVSRTVYVLLVEAVRAHDRGVKEVRQNEG